MLPLTRGLMARNLSICQRQDSYVNTSQQDKEWNMAEYDADIEDQEEEAEGKPAWMIWAIRSGVFIGLVVAAFAVSRFVLYPMYKQAKLKNMNSVAQLARMGDVFHLKDLTVNPLATNGRRFVVAEYALEAHNPEVIKELQNREPQIRDEFIRYLRQHTATQILDLNFQEESKKELTQMVNDLLYSGDIDSMYYTKLILQ
ncbi:MAG: hypothetical protein D6762_08820 [Candidatus Neomarinimicrobiota bacterium]|nr:MAG: hypothetical protein D6762_08820 [Candidatus Neomarinimicrobiota bacterium]